MKVTVFDWAFSTPHQCNWCDGRPEDYWQMAQIKIKTIDNKYRLIWVCMNCLGERVSTIEK